MPRPTVLYRGRFAPSPTGPLHLGSLIAALASYLDARHQAGQWLVRIEDLDPPREQPGAANRILHCLTQHGLHWDAEVLWQSERATAYEQALKKLHRAGHLFNCDCTRAKLGANGACNGRCQPRQPSIKSPHSVRVIADDAIDVRFHDNIQPKLIVSPLSDFVLRRKDQLIAYQLAVAVDDNFQGITHVVRGSDLLDSSPRQIYLQRLLNYKTPSYAHVPVITTLEGHKFSKQNHAPALNPAEAASNLRKALQFLQQQTPPANLTSTDSILEFASRHWSLASVPGKSAISINTLTK